MLIDLTGKVAFVTGAKRSIGATTAITLAEYGADIVINDLTITDEDDTVVAIKKFGRKVLLCPGDVSKEEEVNGMFEKIKETFGKLDILVNNAGVTRDGMMKKMSPEKFMSTFEINCLSTFLCTKAALPLMQAAGGGAVVNFSSVVGFKGNIGQVNYVGSKAAIFGMTKTMALEMARDKIRVNAVAPGFIDTPMTQVIPEDIKKTKIDAIPLKRMGTTQDIANAVLFLVSDMSTFISGQVIHINGAAFMG